MLWSLQAKKDEILLLSSLRADAAQQNIQVQKNQLCLVQGCSTSV